ncbi:uncharacterized protein KY384_003432 [Bacidia gigantensis]|uniref:uncharacterized protein n=1 Tax=Bacidia gigantensis TaxID=2732470 RepID=UPI001D047721|nr:uncharacterized protein KY384_003432 [Bacidia gigantensis]KAG8531796.1 hypothetical protein KY384_003432 [Bacidia gigantensis]
MPAQGACNAQGHCEERDPPEGWPACDYCLFAHHPEDDCWDPCGHCGQWHHPSADCPPIPLTTKNVTIQHFYANSSPSFFPSPHIPHETSLGHGNYHGHHQLPPAPAQTGYNADTSGPQAAAPATAAEAIHQVTSAIRKAIADEQSASRGDKKKEVKKKAKKDKKEKKHKKEKSGSAHSAGVKKAKKQRKREAGEVKVVAGGQMIIRKLTASELEMKKRGIALPDASLSTEDRDEEAGVVRRYARIESDGEEGEKEDYAAGES